MSKYADLSIEASGRVGGYAGTQDRAWAFLNATAS